MCIQGAYIQVLSPVGFICPFMFQPQVTATFRDLQVLSPVQHAVLYSTCIHGECTKYLKLGSLFF
jgi:hypothetical protein